jgi:hypothetical protein
LNAQTRMFVSLGGSLSAGGNATTKFGVSGNLAGDVEWDKKVMGTLHVVTGISTFGVSYSSSNTSFGSYTSKFNAQYVGVPVMARWNVGNRNFLYLDMGLITYYLAYAKLTESIQKFGSTQTYSGNIAPYSNRLYIGFKVQFGFAINRLSISDFFIYQFKGQETINNLENHWGLNSQQSTYLISNGYSDFRVFGIKLSYRIR